MRNFVTNSVAAFTASMALCGCVSMADVNGRIHQIDLAWKLDNQRTEDEHRYRVVDAPYAVAFEATRKTFLALGMPIQASKLADGIILAENVAPAPLTRTEWLEVKRIEEPRMREIGGWILRLEDDPSGYVITVKATLRPIGQDKTIIVVDYTLDSPKLRALGVQPSEQAPPSAVRMASEKMWAGLQQALSEVHAPALRKRRPNDEA